MLGHELDAIDASLNAALHTLQTLRHRLEAVEAAAAQEPRS